MIIIITCDLLLVHVGGVGVERGELISRFRGILYNPLLGSGFRQIIFPILGYSIKPIARKWIQATYFSKLGLFYKIHC